MHFFILRSLHTKNSTWNSNLAMPIADNKNVAKWKNLIYNSKVFFMYEGWDAGAAVISAAAGENGKR